jgi:BMFP domain-containing protein YqiC
MLNDVEKRVDAVNLRTSVCEENILNRVSTRLANNVTQQMHNISNYAANAMQSFTTNIQETIDQHLLLCSENIAVMHQSSYDRMEARMAAMEKKLQEQAELL